MQKRPHDAQSEFFITSIAAALNVRLWLRPAQGPQNQFGVLVLAGLKRLGRDGGEWGRRKAGYLDGELINRSGRTVEARRDSRQHTASCSIIHCSQLTIDLHAAFEQGIAQHGNKCQRRIRNRYAAAETPVSNRQGSGNLERIRTETAINLQVTS